jgi:undecaprenyl diphosphate synthase
MRAAGHDAPGSLARREARLRAALDPLRIPRHIAIIMDGNGRWAELRGLSRIEGHRAGREAIRRTLEGARECGVEILTLYAFSTENWRRPPEEVQALMSLLIETLDQEAEDLQRNGVRFRASGLLAEMPGPVRDALDRVIALTRLNTAITLNLARAAAAGEVRPEDITEEVVRRFLFAPDLPDPDLLIRTGGEQRLSNFLLWQAAYAELYFTGVRWPDFQKVHLLEAIASFQRRDRRFGGLDDG